MEKQYYSQKDYDRVVAAAKEKYGYDNMSDSQKEGFDQLIDKNYGLKDEDTDSSDGIRSDSDKPEKRYLSQKDYDRVVADVKEKQDYEHMSDAQKERIDKAIDDHVGLKDEKTEKTDSVDNRSDIDKYKDNMKQQWGYEKMSDEQKENFDHNLDKYIEQQTAGDSGDEDHDKPEKVLRRRM